MFIRALRHRFLYSYPYNLCCCARLLALAFLCPMPVSRNLDLLLLCHWSWGTPIAKCCSRQVYCMHSMVECVLWCGRLKRVENGFRRVESFCACHASFMSRSIREGTSILELEGWDDIEIAMIQGGICSLWSSVTVPCSQERLYQPQLQAIHGISPRQAKIENLRGYQRDTSTRILRRPSQTNQGLDWFNFGFRRIRGWGSELRLCVVRACRSKRMRIEFARWTVHVLLSRRQR